MKNFFKIIENNIFMLKYILKYTPGLVVYNTINNVFRGFIATLTGVYVAKYILDAFQSNKTIKDVAVFLVIVVFANILSSLLSAYYNEIFSKKRKEILFEKLNTELFEKAKNIELACYDNPSFYNDYVWAISEADGRALEVMENFSQFFRQITVLTTVAAIILSIDWVGIVVALLSTFISLIIMTLANKYHYNQSKEQKPLQRKRDYISRVMYLSDYSKEIRLSSVKNKLERDFSSTNKKLVNVIKYYGKKITLLNMIEKIGNAKIFTNGLYVLYLIFLVLVKKSISFGDFFSLYSGTFELTGVLYSFSYTVTSFQKLSLYIERFRMFLDYEPKMKDGNKNIPEKSEDVTIEFKDVTFKYDGADEPTLYNINLNIKPREKIALVGYNGAGKTTLVKLLMRLYDVTDGSISMNNIDIREFSREDYYNCFGVVFQDFKLFAAMISENVMMDRIKPEDEQEVLNALSKSDFNSKLEKLPDGISTVLTREFDKAGVNLSGGEAQKVAISRIFPRNSKVVILDEPSSALDPVTEYYINQSMLKAAENKTIIYISHRLSTTKMADRIIMLENGRIIEEGSHEQLMGINGKYAKMFNIQAKKYNLQF